MKIPLPGENFGCLCRKLAVGLILFCGGFLPETTEAQAIRDPYAAMIEKDVRSAQIFGGPVLRRLHPTDLMRALAMADPTFANVDPYHLNGSDPSVISQRVELRASGLVPTITAEGGMNSLPLIIVDGYESTAQRLADMDILTVERVAILKDAGALALFGLRGANGVIYITTNRLMHSDLVVNYTFNGGAQFADLSSYNLMDAQQKVELERRLWYYAINKPLYDERNPSTAGADEWLNKALQTGVVNRHNIEVQGAESSLRYKFTAVAAPANSGVMKSTQREQYGIGAALNYSGKRLSISNDLRMDVTSGQKIPNITLLDFAMINPYYAESNSIGTQIQELGQGTFNPQLSPVYELNSMSFEKSSTKNVTNNLTAWYNLVKGLRLGGSIAYSKDFIKYDRFTSHLSNIYYNWEQADIPYRGEYAIGRNNLSTVEERLMLDYNLRRGDHSLQLHAAGHIYDKSIYRDNYSAIGFPNATMSYITFAKEYAQGSKPAGVYYDIRMASIYGYANYDYDDRYTASLTLRNDKSSQLSGTHGNATFYSLTAGWNIHNEKWLYSSKMVNRLVLTASTGTSGQIDFGTNQISNIYGYDLDDFYLDLPGNSPLGLLSLKQISRGNPDLKWRTLHNSNIAIDAKLFNRIVVQANYYNTLSDNLLSAQIIAPVYGTKTKVVNGGGVRNSGLEFMVSGDVIRSNSLSVLLLTNGNINKNRIEGFSQEYISMHNDAVMAGSAESYLGGRRPFLLKNGASANTIYAVKRQRVDPESGRNVYLDQNGRETYTWSAQDLVEVGDMTPDIVGNFGLNAVYKRFNINVMMGYSVGGDIYNLTKEMRVENGSPLDNNPTEINNSWQQPGNESPWSNIMKSEKTGPISDFVEQNNWLSLSSVNVNYSLIPLGRQFLFINSLKIGVTGNNLIYRSQANFERGWITPYTKSVIFSLKAIF